MTEKLEIYKCQICGNTVEVVLNGYGQLICCEQNMILLKEQTKNDELLEEKHVPIITRKEDGVTIRVGATPHPMIPEHYITFIEAHSADKRYVKRKYLYPGEEPALDIKCGCETVVARELCNIHGLWSSKHEIGE